MHKEAKMKRLGVLSVLLLLVSCINIFPKIKLDDILIQPGDLPLGYYGGQIYHPTGSKDFWQLSSNDYIINQTFRLNQKPRGEITIVVYKKDDQAKIVYSSHEQLINEDYSVTLQNDKDYGEDYQVDLEKTIIEEIEWGGEDAIIYSFKAKISGVVFEDVIFLFHRCNALVEINFTDTSSHKEIIEYAKKIDSRLQERICR